MKRFLHLGLAAACTVLAGCATKPQQLYYWGTYQENVYKHFSSPESGTEQIGSLEAGLEKARSEGLKVPPGYNAHLALLYGQQERSDKMAEYLEAEKSLYPEGKSYVDFLLRKFKKAD